MAQNPFPVHEKDQNRRVHTLQVLSHNVRVQSQREHAFTRPESFAAAEQAQEVLAAQRAVRYPFLTSLAGVPNWLLGGEGGGSVKIKLKIKSKI